ncbi:RND family efflux transporter MFP subunit [Chromohalobacter marismortui]|uniref:RND family efflux transporter MFP subunit n=1 Tax=Chromohalobacter marismortui TaxID=42055 RepID=A0A4R7NLG5_9GAMM|nr:MULTISPECIES: HlyD family secretion protein [Chromohalobacter]MCI0510166.1 HlyD family secretion protein [Chromohalobacter sp.]MCI0594534.1 HlyD family secretion protein [Chromohalobacter sp.]TDU21583.1 RND family efflux transporter MFP subunit [Chromohalobacter marismortui]
MRTSLRMLTTLVIVALAIAAGVWLWHYYLYTPWTRDGRVRAEVITIAPDVSGWVHQLSVNNTQHVEKGDTLFKINQARYQTAVDKAEAVVALNQAQLELKRHEEQRRNRLSNQAISGEDLEIARINTRVAKANLAEAKANLASAQLDLKRTVVEAPAAGHILNLHLSEGNYVTAGNPVMALVKDASYYVTGYFEETKISRIEVGDPAKVTLMSGDTELRGRVAGIGRGIANTNTSLNSQLLPQVEPTFNWVRLAQRIPVRIELAQIPKDTLLSAGMTATIHIVDASDTD